MHKYVGACVSGRSMGLYLIVHIQLNIWMDEKHHLDERVDFKNGGADLVL